MLVLYAESKNMAHLIDKIYAHTMHVFVLK